MSAVHLDRECCLLFIVVWSYVQYLGRTIKCCLKLSPLEMFGFCRVLTLFVMRCAIGTKSSHSVCCRCHIQDSDVARNLALRACYVLRSSFSCYTRVSCAHFRELDKLSYLPIAKLAAPSENLCTGSPNRPRYFINSFLVGIISVFPNGISSTQRD
jgi:hypothetical protein